MSCPWVSLVWSWIVFTIGTLLATFSEPVISFKLRLFVKIKEPTVLVFCTLSDFEIHHGHFLVLVIHGDTQWYKLSVSSFSKWRSFGLGDAPSISDQLTLHFLLILPLKSTRCRLNLNHNQGGNDKEKNYIYICICQGMPLLARPHYYCAKFMTVTCNQTYPSRCERAVLFVSFTNDTFIWEQNRNA